MFGPRFVHLAVKRLEGLAWLFIHGQPLTNAGGSAQWPMMSRERKEPMKPVTIKICITCDDGSGEREHTFEVPVQPQEIPTAEAPPTIPVTLAPLKRKQVSPEFARFIESGDISEIKSDPEHRKHYKNYVFCQITGMKNRTLYALKPTRINNQYVGIMPPAFWDQEVIDELTSKTEGDGVLNVVILDDGTKPSVIHDIMIVDDWHSLGRTFNALYRQPRNLE